jgi:hypothetical protein
MKTILLAALFAAGVAFTGTTGALAADGQTAIHKAANASSFTLSARRHKHCRIVEVCRGPWWAKTCSLERVCVWR